MNAMPSALKSIVIVNFLGKNKAFKTCFGHVFSKACQYGIVEKKILEI
jgi:hypothetical protein